MPINNITQTISTLPPAGKRGIDVQTQFVIKQEDFQDHLQGTTVTELNTLKDQLNSRIGEINSTATTMNGYANTASAGASTATTKAGEASTSASDALAYKNQAETFKNNASASATKASQWADNNYNVEVETGKYSAKHWSTVAQNATANKIDKVTSTDNAVVRFDGVTGQVQNSSVMIDDSGNIGIGTGSNINAKLDVVGSVRQYNPGTSASSVMNHVNDAKNWYVGLRGDSSNAYSIADETRQRFLLDVAGNTLHLSPNGGLGYGTGSGGTVTQLTDKSTAVTLNKPTGQIITSSSALAAGASVGFYFYNSLIEVNDNIIVTTTSGDGTGNSYGINVSNLYVGAAAIYITNKTGASRSESLTIKFDLIKGAIS